MPFPSSVLAVFDKPHSVESSSSQNQQQTIPFQQKAAKTEGIGLLMKESHFILESTAISVRTVLLKQEQPNTI